jgi:hypothetical protein
LDYSTSDEVALTAEGELTESSTTGEASSRVRLIFAAKDCSLQIVDGVFQKLLSYLVTAQSFHLSKYSFYLNKLSL